MPTVLNWIKSKFLNQAETYSVADPQLVRALHGYATYAGKAVTKDTAVRCASFLSGVKMLANDVAKMPRITFERKMVNGRQRTSQATNNPLYSILKDVPNQWMTAFQLTWMQIFHLFMNGNFYIQKVTNQAGDIVSLMPLNPWLITRRWDRKQNPPVLYFDYNDGATSQTFTTDQVWSGSIMSCYGADGEAIIALAKEALSVMMASDEISGRFFANGMHAHGFVSIPPEANLDPAEAQKLTDDLNSFYAGSRNAGKFPLIPFGGKYEMMGFTAQESQLLESRKWNAEEVIRLLGGAPLLVKLGYGEKNSTYAASSAFLEEYFSTALMPLTVNIEQTITRDLIAPAQRGRFYVEHDADAVIRGDIKSRYDAYAVAIDKGWMSPNDVLEEENENTVDGLDYYHVSPNAILVDGEILTVGVRGGPPGSVQTPPEPEPSGPPAPSQPPTENKIERLIANPVAEAAAERILRKEEMAAKPCRRDFIADSMGMSKERAEQYLAKRPELTRDEAKEFLLQLAIGETA